MMRIFIVLSIMLFLLSGCSVKYHDMEHSKVQQLTSDLIHLGVHVDKEEAQLLAHEALLYPRLLAQKYGLVSPPTFHNLLINTGLKERGLCYEWSEDMITHLKNQHYQSFDLRWGVANKGELDEHNSVVVVVKNAPFWSGILIDPWRHSGELYWSKLHEDAEYKWVENVDRSRYFGTIGVSLE